MLAQVELDGYTVIADKGFAGAEFEALMRELRALFLRPDRKDEPARFGNLGGVRQTVESVFDTFKGQLSLEQHGAHTMPGLITRIAQRLLRSQPASGTTGRSATPAATSPPTTTNPMESLI
jgi:hypothetical protein